MKKVFLESNMRLAENQDEYNTLEINVNPALPEVPMTAQFVFSPDQLKRIASNGGKFYVTQWTFGNNYAPIAIELEKPATLSKLDEKGLRLFYLEQNIAQHIEAQLKLTKNLEALIATKDAVENPKNDINLN